MALGPGSRLGPYEISGPLGKGGMGEVFRARDTRLQRDVAVKALPDEFSRDAERLARFQREARLLASLNHPNVATIHGIEESDAHTYLILECIEGESLAMRLSAGPLPIEEALRVGAEIAAGLAAAHDAGVIHRDLKPGNVMLRRDGGVKLLDFGLARGAEPGSAADGSVSPTISLGTQAGVILGTAAYMSPEQARGRALDKRSDIFSFGCVLYECLAGRRAFPGASVSDTLSAIVADEPDWAALPPETPRRVRELLKRCLQKDPRRRLHDVSDAKLDLEEALSPAATIETFPLATSSPFARARDGRARIAWLVIAALVGGGIAAAIVWSRRPAADRPPPRLRGSLPLPEGVRLALGARPAVAISPDGASVVFRGIQGGVPRLYLRRLDGAEASPIAGTEFATNPFFSPDGEWLGFFTQKEIKKVPLGGGSAVRICDTTPVAHGGTWGEDGGIVFARTGNGGLYRVSSNGGKPAPFTTLAAGEHAHSWPQILPGEKGTLVTIVFGSDFQDLDSSRIAVIEPGTQRRRIVLEGSGYARYLDSGQIVFIRGKRLFAASFDLEQLKTTGPPVALPEGLFVDDEAAIAHFAAAGGTLVSPSGPPLVRPVSTVWAVGRDGKGSPLPLPPGRFSHPRLSPDGKRVALVRFDRTSFRLFLFERSRGILSLLTTEPGRFFCPVWSPDSQRLAFTFFDVGEPRMALKPADSSRGLETLAPNEGRAEFPSSWSPDGKVILFTVEDRKTESDSVRVPASLWTETLGPKPAPRLWLGGGFRNISADFSPDGRWIAYVSDESGQKEVYLRAYPGPGPRIKVSPNGGDEPTWTRGGRELIYRVGDQFLAVDLPAGAEPVPGPPRLLFSGKYSGGSREDSPREYDVSADGNEFLVTQPEPVPEVARQMLVLSGWFRDVRAGRH